MMKKTDTAQSNCHLTMVQYVQGIRTELGKYGMMLYSTDSDIFIVLLVYYYMKLVLLYPTLLREMLLLRKWSPACSLTPCIVLPKALWHMQAFCRHFSGTEKEPCACLC